MSIALVSDIHANSEALFAVLADIAALRKACNIIAIGCLGDIVNYGPNPRECLHEVVENFDWILQGNHDECVSNSDSPLFERFNQHAQESVLWTRKQLGTGQLMLFFVGREYCAV